LRWLNIVGCLTSSYAIDKEDSPVCYFFVRRFSGAAHGMVTTT
jgi:hypothetical protein